MKWTSWLVFAIGVVGAVLIFQGQRGGSSSASSSAASLQGWDKSRTLDVAMATGTQTNKPVLALATADWCPPCQRLKSDTLSDPRVVQWLEANVVTAYVDGTNENPDVGRLNVSGFPTFVLIRNGAPVGSLTGYRPPDQLLAWLNQTANQ